jgi:hypothetical protein
MTASRNAPHLLRVDGPPERYASLFAAARAEGLRLGWLDLAASAPASPPASLPPSLDTAAGLGALRAVAVTGDRSVAGKPLKGAPVLRDLLREHFRGCVLVLVCGEGLPPGLAILREEGEGWTVTAPGEAARAFTTGGLAAALRRPRPWGPPLPPRVPRPPVVKKEKKRRGQRVKKAKDKKDIKDKKDRKDRKDKKDD